MEYMKEFIGNSLIAKLKPSQKAYDVWDTKITGFILRILPSGAMVYRCEYGRGKRITLGKTTVLTPAQARDKAKQILSQAAIGELPVNNKKSKKALTLNSFISHEYESWRIANRKNGKDDKGTKSATVNRDIIILKSTLTKAVEWELISEHPLQKLKQFKTDSIPKIRYLAKDEETEFKKALISRDNELRASRSRANEWRKARGYDYFPDLEQVKFPDHITPMVLLSLNTGLRRGELFSLQWENITLERAMLTVRGDTAKSGKTRHIPLNVVAVQVLKDWRTSNKGSGLVFANTKTGESFGHVKRGWATLLKLAEIKNFRWHDMRHHFASKLVMAGVDLNTVRELLGHADITMTLRYAHLAPEHKANAVAKLVEA
jgi:integrase